MNCMSVTKVVEQSTKETDTPVVRILRYFVAFSYLMSAPADLVVAANLLLKDLENEEAA